MQVVRNPLAAAIEVAQTSYKILAKTGKYLDARRLPHLLKPCLNLSNFFLGNIAADQPLYILL